MKEIIKMLKAALTMRKKECSILEKRAYGRNVRIRKPDEHSPLEVRVYGSVCNEKDKESIGNDTKSPPKNK